MKKFLMGAVVLSLCTTAMAQKLVFEYCVTPLGAGQFKYDIVAKPDAGWAPGMGWAWFIVGDAQQAASPLTGWVGGPPPPPYTSWTTSGGFHNGPTLNPVTTPWIPASGTDTLKITGTANVDLPQGSMLCSAICCAVGGAQITEFYQAKRVCGTPCTGNEAIKKAKCKNGKLKVKTVGANPGDSVNGTAFGACGAATASGTANGAGKATLKFTGCGTGAGSVDVTWGCGFTTKKAYQCP